MKLALVFLAALALGVDGLKTNNSAICPNNTMGKLRVGPPCVQLISSGVSAADITIIVDRHNEVRRQVAFGNETLGSPGPQPPAANMRMMIWDPELAKDAQRSADQCVLARDTCRKENISASVGQSIGKIISFKSTADWSEMIDQWTNEARLVDKNNVGKYSERLEQKAHHYSRMVWAPSYKIGCGFASYKKDNDSQYTNLYVCNYGPGGILLGSQLYVIGVACSQCPPGTVCSNGLCNKMQFR